MYGSGHGNWWWQWREQRLQDAGIAYEWLVVEPGLRICLYAIVGVRMFFVHVLVMLDTSKGPSGPAPHPILYGSNTIFRMPVPASGPFSDFFILFEYFSSIWLKPMAALRSFILTFEDGRICAIREPRKHQTRAKTWIPKLKIYTFSAFLVYALRFFATIKLFFWK